MTLDDLVNETLVQKHRRLRRAKCPHDEIYMSVVRSGENEYTNMFCLDCGLSLPRPMKDIRNE